MEKPDFNLMMDPIAAMAANTVWTLSVEPLQADNEALKNRVKELENAIKSVRGIEAFIYDNEMKSVFQRNLYTVVPPKS